MDWSKICMDIISDLKGDLSQEGGLLSTPTLKITTPKTVPTKIKTRLRASVPESFEIEYVVGPKKSTLNALHG